MPDDDDEYEDEEGEEEEVREVESLRTRRQTDAGEEEFRVRWAGCNYEQDTWVTRREIVEIAGELAAEEHFARLEAMEAAQKHLGKKHSSGGKKKGSGFVRF